MPPLPWVPRGLPTHSHEPPIPMETQRPTPRLPVLSLLTSRPLLGQLRGAGRDPVGAGVHGLRSPRLPPPQHYSRAQLAGEGESVERNERWTGSVWLCTKEVYEQRMFQNHMANSSCPHIWGQASWGPGCLGRSSDMHRPPGRVTSRRGGVTGRRPQVCPFFLRAQGGTWGLRSTECSPHPTRAPPGIPPTAKLKLTQDSSGPSQTGTVGAPPQNSGPGKSLEAKAVPVAPQGRLGKKEKP